jgi:hypothetical protein
MKLITTVLHSIVTKGCLRDWGLCIIFVNSDVFGIGFSELTFVEQRTCQNDNGKMGRFIGLYGSSRAAAAGHKMLARRRRQKAHSVGLYLVSPVPETEWPWQIYQPKLNRRPNRSQLIKFL